MTLAVINWVDYLGVKCCGKLLSAVGLCEELGYGMVTWRLSLQKSGLILLSSAIWLASREPWSDLWPLSLSSDLKAKVSIWQRRAEATVLARSLILTMRKMQQSKYKEVEAPSPISWIYNSRTVKKWFWGKLKSRALSNHQKALQKFKIWEKIITSAEIS